MLTPEDLQAIKALMDDSINAAITPVNERLDKIEGRLDKVEGEVKDVKVHVSNLEKQMSDLEENIAEVRSATNHLLGWADKVSVITKVAL